MVIYKKYKITFNSFLYNYKKRDFLNKAIKLLLYNILNSGSLVFRVENIIII